MLLGGGEEARGGGRARANDMGGGEQEQITREGRGDKQKQITWMGKVEGSGRGRGRGRGGEQQQITWGGGGGGG